MSSINITGGRRSIADGAIGATLGGTGLGASCVGRHRFDLFELIHERSDTREEGGQSVQRGRKGDHFLDTNLQSQPSRYLQNTRILQEFSYYNYCYIDTE